MRASGGQPLPRTRFRRPEWTTGRSIRAAVRCQAGGRRLFETRKPEVSGRLREQHGWRGGGSPRA